MFLERVVIQGDTFPNRGAYPFSLGVLQQTGSLPFTRPVTVFAGENGTGKSTLLEAIAICCGIHIWRPEFTLRCEANPFERQLYRHLSVTWSQGPVPGSYFGSQNFSHFARKLEEWALADRPMLDYFGGKSLITQSHGQSLMSYFESRYQRKGLYFLDEPETALSPKSQVELLNLIVRESGKGHAQFVIATHSPILMACPQALIYGFDGPKIAAVKYEDTDHYRIYKAFMADPHAFTGIEN
ncbi:MAG TPA: AAA family ATPase [Desulfotignum sp.]|nr:AAA family ATPase [Desulfotignum sp.]